MRKEYRRDPLWPILVEAVKANPVYEGHKMHVRDEVLPKKPDITPEELSKLLSIPIGEALVILDELRITVEEVEEELSKPLPRPIYEHVAIGGTFNEIHYGHLMLILMALRLGKRVLIGVTTDEFVKELDKKHEVRSYAERVEGLRRELEKRGWIERCKIIPLRDPYGPAVEDPSIEALITSPFTHFRGVEINELRVKRGLKPLRVVVCPLVVAEDGKPLSSTRIARGEISLDGKSIKRSHHPDHQ